MAFFSSSFCKAGYKIIKAITQSTRVFIFWIKNYWFLKIKIENFDFGFSFKY